MRKFLKIEYRENEQDFAISKVIVDGEVHDTVIAILNKAEAGLVVTSLTHIGEVNRLTEDNKGEKALIIEMDPDKDVVTLATVPDTLRIHIGPFDDHKRIYSIPVGCRCVEFYNSTRICSEQGGIWIDFD